MHEKTCLINQPAGIGDILYCQKIADYYTDIGYYVYWPIAKSIEYLKNYIISSARFQKNNEKKYDKIVELEKAGIGVKPEEIMVSKYKLAGVDPVNWKKYLILNRRQGEELIPREEKYNLICDRFATFPNYYKIKINPINGVKNIYITYEHTPFHWCAMIENAIELHFVDTVFTYLIEKLNVKARRMCLYPRKPFHDKIITKSLWDKPWEYME